MPPNPKASRKSSAPAKAVSPPLQGSATALQDAAARPGAGWEWSKLKYVSTCVYGLSQPPKYSDGGLPFLRATNVQRGKIVEQGLLFVEPADLPDSRVTRLEVGDIIVVRSGAYTGDSAIVPERWVGAVAGFDMVLKIGSGNEPRFMAWLLLAPEVLEHQIELLRTRAAQPHLNAEELGGVVFHRPPLHQQKRLADYLDFEIGRLDELVRAKEGLLELVAEKRRALITRAVTRGLNPKSPLRDSGIPWLGLIPAHWEVKKLSYIISLQSGEMISSSEIHDSGKYRLWGRRLPWLHTCIHP